MKDVLTLGIVAGVLLAAWAIETLRDSFIARDQLRPFTTDGCSGSFMCLLRIIWRIRFWLGRTDQPKPTWEADCEAHDARYHPGGTIDDRIAADVELMRAIAARGYPRLARMMFLGVSLGGVWWLPLPWRWGYGYPWLRPYTDKATGGARQ